MGHLNVYVQPTTGGRIQFSLPQESTIGHLKTVVAKRLRVPRDKIVLLYKNKQLVDGTLEKNNITEGSKLILLPNVETGIMAQNPEQCVMQALETLNESQVDNFLAGRSPLNLTMRLGDHMMFIQLQLSNVSSPGSTTSSSSSPSSLPTPPTSPTSPSPVSLFSSTPVTSAVSSLPSPPPSPNPVKTSSGSTQSSFSNKVFAEASRNLTHTLKQLSSSALAKKMNEGCDGRCCIARRQGGAVIESMYHHGRGVFSGTFSGTLNPLLQDTDGRPRRNICTIIHILNDLLGASSHCNPSAQCLCSNTSSSKFPKSSTIPPKVDDESRKDEDKALKEKVQRIQTLLKEKRLNRSLRREMRSSPYSPVSRYPSSKKCSHSAKSKGVFLSSSISSECGEQKLVDFSSETAVA